MATEAQVLANRLNAKKSTGPRTAAGKAVVAQNAVRHGLLAEQAVIRDEDPGEFEFYRQQLLAELHPGGAMESVLAERAVGLAWRLRRAERVQAQVFDTMLAKDDSPISKLCRSFAGRGRKSDPDTGGSALGRVVTEDFGNSRVLDRLCLYERRIEHSLYKTLDELEKLRLLRQINPPAEEPTPGPVEPQADEPLCETKPISPDSVTENPTESEPEKRLTSPDRPGQPGSDAGARGLTGQTGGRRLVTVQATAPVRDESGPSPGALSSIGKEEPR